MKIYDYKNKSFNKRKAFTLVELLIVIAIIGILFIVLVSKIDFASDKAKMTGVQTDFRSFQVALETVAREHDGFNTFGWDYGDTNGDRIRNTYDEGDLNINDKKDENEVWTGHKVPGEEWTGIYTLKNPANPDDKSAIGALQDAINANLDPKLHITIHDDFTITMANSAKDPWKTEYHGVYLSNAVNDSGDRGAIVIYSNGSNQEFGSEEKIENGRVTVSVPGNNVHGQDDMSIATVYSYNNGYGEVNTTTNGFSQNQKVDIVGSGNMGDGVDTPFIPAENLENRVAGLYKTGTNTLLYSWDELVEMGVITNNKATGNGYETSPSDDIIKLLSGDLQLPTNITSVPSYAFRKCRNLTGLIVPKEITSIGIEAFYLTGIKTLVVYGKTSFSDSLESLDLNNIYYDSVEAMLQSSWSIYSSTDSILHHSYMILIEDFTNIYINGELLEHLVVPEGITSIPSGILAKYSKLKTVELSSTVTTIGSGAFEKCTSLTSINLSNVKTINKAAFKNTLITEADLTLAETIGCAAFAKTQLTHANIGDKITKIYYNAFVDCSEYFELHCAVDLDTWTTLLYQPDQYIKMGVTGGQHYKLFLNNVEVKGEFDIPSHWTSVPNVVFSGVVGITSLNVHNNVTKLGDYSFYNSGIVDLNLGDTLQEIGNYAFSYTPVKILNIPDSVITLGAWSFYYCEEMLEVNINETSQMTTMGDGAFRECELIESLFIPPLIKRLDAHSLVIYCNHLKEFTFSPNTQLEYLNVSFGYVDYVTVYLPDTVKVVKDLDINVNWNSGLVVGENSQLERMEGKMFDRYFGDIYITKNLSYISESWTDFQFSPKIKIHPENQYFKYENGCLIDINNKRIIASNSGATVPTDGSVTAIGEAAGYGGIRYIPKEITYVHCFAWWNAHGSVFDLVYEGTMEEWKSIVSGGSLYSINTITCSDGVLYGAR